MSRPLISAIIPLRNRSGDRLENCLRSLRWQGLPGEQVEIVISDFGSQGEHRAATAASARAFGARVVYEPTQEVWNRSRALNIGIQAARGEFLFCTDVDMIFAPNFLATAASVQHRYGGRAMVLCHCSDLPESVPMRPWALEDFPWLQGEAALRQTSGTGACQIASRDFFEFARGYDEKFLYWGAEDVDMTARASRYGLTLAWMDDAVTSMLHQWHPTTKNDRRLRFHLNRLRYKLTKHRVVKNPQGWGLRR
jgi:glycosyltransferase involved in cell wall biosynthesis